MTLYATRIDVPNPIDGDKAIHGGKGAGLLNMTKVGLPVPEALILTTEAWNHYRVTGDLNTQVLDAISQFLADYPNAMFSVRSGAPISMPGMMDTILNVGATPDLDLSTYNGAFRRFTTGWLEIVKGVSKERVNELMSLVSERAGGHTERSLKLLTGVIERAESVKVPVTRPEQVYACVRAVFNSWDTPRAKAYRKLHDIPEDMGTACVIQRMVMGTASGLSGSGVMFSRDPATGEPALKGEIAFNAQGEEVVSGEVTPLSLSDLKAATAPAAHQELWKALSNVCKSLELYFGDVQDIEFTVESGVLYILQTRTAKMSAKARIETAVSLAGSLLDSPQEALSYVQERVTKATVERTRVTIVDSDSPAFANGLAAAPGAISGKIISRTHPLDKVDKSCILVAEETAPEDFPIMAKCGGILTSTGGFTCHSAVVARGIGVPAVVGTASEGCELKFTMKGVVLNEKFLSWGDTITLDGTSGKVYMGACTVKKQQPPRSIYQFLHDTATAMHGAVPPGAYYYDCGIGPKVALPIDPHDMEKAAAQFDRARSLRKKGKQVAYVFEMGDLHEDMFAPSGASLFTTLKDNHGPSLKGERILYGVPAGLSDEAETILGAKVNSNEEVQILDLLDLLKGASQ